MLHFHLVAIRQDGVRIDLLFQHAQLIAHAHHLVKKYFQGNFLRLQRGVRRVQHHLPFVPADAQLVHDRIRILQPEFRNGRFERFIDELLQRGFQAGHRYLRFKRG